MTERKMIKRQTMNYKTLSRKLKTEQHELRCSGRESSSCSTSDIRRVTVNDANNMWYANRVGHQHT